MAQTIQAGDKRLSWHGLISLEHTEQGARPWRLPHDQLDLFPPITLVERAAMPAGVRLAFRSDTTSLSGTITTSPETSPLDLCCNGDRLASVNIAGQETFEFTRLPSGEKLIELWLPQFGQFYLRDITIADGATLTPFEDVRSRWITYGSSITHCRNAASPMRTWPAIVAREHNVNLTCLGYGGNCHLEPMVARMIRDLPADYISVCAGINIYGASSLSTRTLRAALIGFVQIVREHHPQTPFALISPICSPPRETTPNAVGLDLRTIRTEVAAAVEALQRHGDRNLYYIDGLQLFGPEHADYLPDQLHPNAEGYEILARNFLKTVAPLLFDKSD